MHRTVTVILSEFSAQTVYAEFARCLSCFPNLNTVQVLWAPHVDRYNQYKKRAEIARSFASHLFPSVHTLVIHDNASYMLRSFPKVLNVTLILPGEPGDYSNYHATETFSELAKSCPKVEYLSCQPLLTLSSRHCMDHLLIMMLSTHRSNRSKPVFQSPCIPNQIALDSVAPTDLLRLAYSVG